MTITWTAPANGGPATAYQLQAGSAQGLANLAAITVAGTTLVVPGVPNGV